MPKPNIRPSCTLVTAVEELCIIFEHKNAANCCTVLFSHTFRIVWQPDVFRNRAGATGTMFDECFLNCLDFRVSKVSMLPVEYRDQCGGDLCILKCVIEKDGLVEGDEAVPGAMNTDQWRIVLVDIC